MTRQRSNPRGSAPPKYRSLDDYLTQHGVRDEIEEAVEKRIVALQLERRRKECAISKSKLAQMVGTSRTQIDRILDPTSQNVSLLTLHRVAKALGKKVHFELIDP